VAGTSFPALNLGGGHADEAGMSVTLAAVAVAPGLAVGSFLNVVASRVPLRRSVATGRSACMSCATPIVAWDNIPLVSYVVLRGRCRHCSARIPFRYPLVELLTALLVVACVLHFGATAEALVAAAFCVVLVAIAAIDAEHRIVPDRIVLPAGAAFLAARIVLEPSVQWPLAALAASGALLLVALAYPAGLGMGDVKLALLLGAALGASVAVALMVGLLAALVPAVVLIVRKGQKAARKTSIPLAPFLALGAVVALFVGETLMNAYLSLG
jgi:leader peptidase (prepilin peptidase) / N-methyltransferase